VIRLEADDPQVRARTLDALADSAGRKPSLTIRCSKCGALLAQAGRTKFGPLFTSLWTAENKLIGETRQVDRMYTVIEQSGPPIGGEQHGVIALLDLPPALSPDLLVRCRDHGDDVLELQQVLTWLRGKSNEETASVKFPLVTYRPPDPLFAQEVAARTSSRVVRQIGGK
jgi:hypothetical protein